MVRTRVIRQVVATAVVVGACSSTWLVGGADPPTPTFGEDRPAAPSPTLVTDAPSPTLGGNAAESNEPPPLVRIVLVGDIMLGRGVAPIASNDPESLFEDVRHVVKAADIAGGNLESPLTLRPHIASNPNDLTADPAAAALLAAAGFDLLSVANNHSGDAGRESVADTVHAVEAAGMIAVGGGVDLDEARAGGVVDHDGLRIAFLAFDATRAGWPAGPTSPGIVHWEEEVARSAVASAAATSDLVVVSIHGGIEYLAAPDPLLAELATELSDWGVDVVWGHGSHVLQPVYVDGSTVVATSLGNFVFDQGRAITELGGVLEVLADPAGVVAFRAGHATHPDRRVRFDGWMLPAGDAVLLDGEWWTLVRPVITATSDPSPLDGLTMGTVTASSLGDATGDGIEDMVVSYRRLPQPHLVRSAFPEHPWTDTAGRTAHLGVFATGDHTPLWAGGALFRPVADVVACHGSVALAFDSLDDPSTVATSGWTWNGFGFDVPPELPGPGTVGCADVDGDGSTEPVITR